MFLVKLISKNNNVELSLYFILIMFIFYALGRIVQSRTSLKKNTTTLAIPIGFVAYLSVTQIFYMPLIFFSLQGNIINFIENIKEFIVIIFVVSYYKEWLPQKKISFSNIRSTSIIIFSTLSLITIFILMTLYFKWFMPTINSSVYTLKGFVNSIEDLANGRKIFFDTHINNISSGFEKYETTYYWMANISHNLNIDVKVIVNIFIPIISVIVVSSIVQSFLIDAEGSIISNAISWLVSLFFIIILGIFGSQNEYFLPLVVIIFILFLLLSFSLQEIPNNKLIITSLILLTSFLSTTYLSLFLMIICGSVATLVSSAKNSNYVFNVFIFLNILFASFVIFISLVLLNTISITRETYRLFVMSLLSMIFITPVYFLWNSDDRKEDQVSVEKNFHENPLRYAFIISLVMILIILLVNHLKGYDTPQTNFKKFLETISNKTWLSITLWLSIIIAPSLSILFLKDYIPNSSILVSASFINILFINPITLTFILSFFHLNITILAIFAPTFFLFVMWIIGLLISNIPDKLRL